MAFLHSHSCESMKFELELFSLPPTQTTIEQANWIHYKPISSFRDSAPIEFVVPGSGDEYIDLAHTMLTIRARILPLTLPVANASGQMPEDTTPGTINNNLHSMLNQIDVYFNGKLVSPPNDAYAYRAYIEILLNYSPDTKKSHLTTALWYDDTAGKMNEIITDGNKGLAKRKTFTAGGKVFTLLGHLHCDVFNQEKFLLNGVEVRLRLVRACDSFSLLGESTSHNLHIWEASLLVRRAKISPGILIAHAKALSKSTAKYPLTRIEVKAITMQSAFHGHTIDNVILGQLPKRLIIGFVSNKVFNGDFGSNPFNFQNYKINYFSLYVDGVHVPSKPLQPDFTQDKLYVDAYHTLFSGKGIHFLNEGNSITKTDYANGYCLFAFHLIPDLYVNDNGHWNLVKHGSVRIEVRFEEAPTLLIVLYTLNMIIFLKLTRHVR
ncbi:uncharacterized protein F54H12.2-like [Belonocnema kinseyi]|uniref:uncharacterized protein F54H12.2-like n=1 Tax=Belonocnema kinseyi TaxID=2817044 RepID=UPI00143D716A|nr:uncharacterized protein F54H12.2-like [Belonocnema kinseyi]